MKTKILLFLAALLTSLMAMAGPKNTEVFTLDHQMSAGCETKIMKNLPYEKGVSNVEVSLQENTITITFDPQKTDTQKLIAGFRKIGFNAIPCIAVDEPAATEEGEAAPAPAGSACCGQHQ